MKLYNLLQQVILEEIQKHSRIIFEGVSKEDVNAVINGDEKGKHYHVSFIYTKENGKTSNRWVQIYDYVKTKQGRDAISAYQVSADGDASKNGWKIFLLNGINNFKVSKVPFYRPISDTNPQIKYTDKNGVIRNNFNTTGNFTPTLDKGDLGLAAINKAKFNYNFGEPTIKKHIKQAADYEKTQNIDKIIPPSQNNKPIPKPIPQNNKPISKPIQKSWDNEPNVEQPFDDIEDNEDFKI